MKALLISSSPHRKKSSTFLLANEVLRGLKKEGAVCQVVHLDGCQVLFCKDCQNCHRKIMKCLLKDDVKGIMRKMLNADAIILASPNYLFQVSASLKALFDRLGHFIHCKRLLGKYAAGVVTSGSGENKEVLDYIKFGVHTCGLQYSGGVSALHLFDDNKKKEAFRLGQRIALDIKRKKVYPDQQKEIERTRQYFKKIILFKRNDWQGEYRYWLSKGWL